MIIWWETHMPPSRSVLCRDIARLEDRIVDLETGRHRGVIETPWPN